MTQEVLSLHPSGVWQEGTNHVRAHLRVADLLLPLHEQIRRWRPPPPSRSFGGVRFCTEKTRHEALCMHAGSVQAGCPEMQNGPCDADTVTVQPCTPSLCIAGCAHQEHRCLCAPLHTEHTASSTPARGPQHLGSPRARVQVSSGTTDLPVHPCTCNEHQGSPRASACVCRPHQESPYAPSHMQTATTDFFAHPYAPLHQHQGPPRTPLHVHPCDKDLPVHNCTYVPAPGISPCAPVCADQHHESPYAPLYVHTSTRTSPCNSACAHQHQRSPSGPLHVHSSTRDLSVHPCTCTPACAPLHQHPSTRHLPMHPCMCTPATRHLLHENPCTKNLPVHPSTADLAVQGCTCTPAPGISLYRDAQGQQHQGPPCAPLPGHLHSRGPPAHAALHPGPLRAPSHIHPWTRDLSVQPCLCTPGARTSPCTPLARVPQHPGGAVGLSVGWKRSSRRTRPSLPPSSQPRHPAKSPTFGPGGCGPRPAPGTELSPALTLSFRGWIRPHGHHHRAPPHPWGATLGCLGLKDVYPSWSILSVGVHCLIN